LLGNYLIYVLFTVLYALLSCLLTFTTITVLPGSLEITNLDDNLSTAQSKQANGKSAKPQKIPTTYYSAAGSGVAEVKVILSGFVLHVRFICIIR
jgi:chloride channel 3/4/5